MSIVDPMSRINFSDTYSFNINKKPAPLTPDGITLLPVDTPQCVPTFFKEKTPEEIKAEKKAQKAAEKEAKRKQKKEEREARKKERETKKEQRRKEKEQRKIKKSQSNNYSTESTQYYHSNSIYNYKDIIDNENENNSINSFNINEIDDLKNNNYKVLLSDWTQLFPDIIGVPNWNYEDFIHERLRFLFRGIDESVFYSQKGFLKELDYNRFNNRPLTLTDGVGYFFYKVFFNFYTSHGLLGGIVPVDSKGAYTHVSNTAIQYLYNNSKSTRFDDRYREFLTHKTRSLIKFAELLKYLSFECPWYFKEIGGLQEAVKLDFEDLTKERKITMAFNPEAIDFRVSALLELYLDACFDNYNQREIVPSNLRKFDMSVLVCQMPMDGVTQNVDKKTQYFSRLSNGDTIYPCEIDIYDFIGENNSKLAFKWILLENCEFDYKSIASTTDTVANENPFSPEYTVDIKFTRSYVRDYNYALGLQDVFSTLKTYL